MTAPATASAQLDVAVGSLVRARGREWVVLPGTTPEFLLLQPLGGGQDDVVGVFPDEGVEPATFPLPGRRDLGDAASSDLLRTALRVGFSSSAGPFRFPRRPVRQPPQLPVRATADGAAPGHRSATYR